MAKKKEQHHTKRLGSIYTPSDFAKLLASWAITLSDQKVLDVGVGEGAITFASYKRLLELGANPENAQRQVYGSEINFDAFALFSQKANENGLSFPNIIRGDFFNTDSPSVRAVIGNPPYVRRSKISNYGRVRKHISNLFDEDNLSQLCDLYIYFLLKACHSLEHGGRLAVVTSDSWLNARYGRAFKRYLQSNFEVNSLISLDRNIFNADVKTLILLATKLSKESVPTGPTRFIRIRNGLAASELSKVISDASLAHKDVDSNVCNLETLADSETWGLYFKYPALFKLINTHEKTVPVCDIADTRIGIQTLAKDFYVVSAETVKDKGIEPQFLTPTAQSNRNYPSPVIDQRDDVFHYLFFCDLKKKELLKTRALAYIKEGEKREVSFRGKRKKVIGYQNKERIERAKRQPWYNLKSEIDRRSRASIIIPRIIAKTFRVYWNKAALVPGEFFIEFRAKSTSVMDEVYLAILSSTLFEFCFRSKAHLYGGGAYSISPGQIKTLPIVNPDKLSLSETKALTVAYRIYLKDEAKGRQQIDDILYEVLGFDYSTTRKVETSCEDLVGAVETFQKNG